MNEWKAHIRPLPVREYPDVGDPFSDELAVSIPLFYSGVDSGGTITFSNFDEDRFKNVHCKGAIWVAMGLVANTDISERGAGIYFHIEDRIWDMACEVFDEFGVPRSVMRKMSIPNSEFRPEVKNPLFGKKFMSLLDEEMDVDVQMIVDSDSFFCTKTGKMFLYDKLVSETFRLNPSAMYSLHATMEYSRWMRGTCEAAGFWFDKDKDAYEQELEAYNLLGLSYKPVKPESLESDVVKYFTFTNVMTIPRREKGICDFLKRNMGTCYQDECLLSVWAFSEGPILSFWDITKIKEISTEDEYLDRVYNGELWDHYVAHMHVNRETQETRLDEYYGLFYEDLTRGFEIKSGVSALGENRKQLRFHCLAIPHAITNDDYIACAFTQKVKKFCQMMIKLGHICIHYGHEESNLICSEHVTVIDDYDLNHTYGDHDWKRDGFKYDQNDFASHVFYSNCNKEIRKRYEPGDFVLAFWGWGHKQISDFVSDLPVYVVEPGIGYDDTFADYRVFESITDMHYQHGASRIRRMLEEKLDDMSVRVDQMDDYERSIGVRLLDELRGWRWWDKNWNMNLPDWGGAVIPNYFDPSQFKYQEDKEDFALFIGRIGEHKGIHVAVKMAEAVGCKLVVAGQGDLERVLRDSLGYDSIPEFIEFVGYVGIEERSDLFARAKAILTPSFYRDPFLGVHIESGFAGTPNISTNWGAPMHTVLHGVTGYLIQSFEHGVWALRNVHKIDPKDCRDWAMNFSMDRVSLMYHEYFHTLRRHIANADNFFYRNDDRTELDWLQRPYSEKKVQERISEIQDEIRKEVNSSG